MKKKQHFNIGYLGFCIAIIGLIMFKRNCTQEIAILLHGIGIFVTVMAVGFYFLDEILGDNKDTADKPEDKE